MQITTTRNFFDKLLIEHAECDADLMDHRHAINAALTSWHLYDWVWNEIEPQKDTISTVLPGSAEDFRSKGRFARWIQAECPALKDMRLIAKGAKHLSDPGLTDHGGAFSNAFSRGFDISRLTVSDPAGESVNFINLLEATIAWWEKLLDDIDVKGDLGKRG
jgi:hypothetical protein